MVSFAFSEVMPSSAADTLGCAERNSHASLAPAPPFVLYLRQGQVGNGRVNVLRRRTQNTKYRRARKHRKAHRKTDRHRRQTDRHTDRLLPEPVMTEIVAAPHKVDTLIARSKLHAPQIRNAYGQSRACCSVISVRVHSSIHVCTCVSLQDFNIRV